MPAATATRGTHAPPAIFVAVERDPFIRLGHVLTVLRQHYPGRKLADHVDLRGESTGPTDCRIIGTKEIEQFGFLDSTRHWAPYDEIALDGFRRWREAGHTGHIQPFPPEAIFADLKVLLADRGEPLRAALAEKPTYPQRAKIIYPRAGRPRIWAMIALAIINSALGHAFYDEYHERHPGVRRSTDNVSTAALLDMPLAAADYDQEAVEHVADLAFQLSVLGEAKQECARQFTQATFSLRERLLGAARGALRLDESYERTLMARAHKLNLIDAPPLGSLLQRSIPSENARVILAGGTAGTSSDRARLVRWEHRVNVSIVSVKGRDWIWASGESTYPSEIGGSSWRVVDNGCEEVSALPSATESSAHALLQRLYALSTEGHSDQAADLLYDAVDRILTANDLGLCNALLASVEVSRLNPSLLRSLLVTTYTASSRLPARPFLAERIRRHLEFTEGPARAERILKHTI